MIYTGTRGTDKMIYTGTRGTYKIKIKAARGTYKIKIKAAQGTYKIKIKAAQRTYNIGGNYCRNVPHPKGGPEGRRTVDWTGRAGKRYILM